MPMLIQNGGQADSSENRYGKPQCNKPRRSGKGRSQGDRSVKSLTGHAPILA